MAILDFANRNELQSIQNEFENLNMEADSIIKGVAATLKEINSESVGEAVDELLITAEDLIVKGGQFVIALGALIDMVRGMIESIVAALLNAAADAISGRSQGTDL